ncbi:TonB-dependent receptor plug domain-containing protein [Porphyromonadaceae bacterium W3.11]|nr:TonB-dependent receptor plug domain-containing protein [Porphyromonadaceae bacterium W3.11]
MIDTLCIGQKRRVGYLTLALLLLAFGNTLRVQAQYNKEDSVRWDMALPNVEVVAKRPYEIIPPQRLNGPELKKLSSFSVADAIRYFSGVQVKDYGGIGGLKTINVRSMGSHHVGVFYDGVQLGNAQNGQVDLGKFSLDNIEEISLYNGQKSETLQSAKDFASASSVYLRSRTPSFKGDKRYHIRASFKTGSFDLINPAIYYEQKISDHVSMSASAELVKSSGKYKFRYRRVHPATHEVMYDTTAIRQNGDILSLRAEAGLYGDLRQGNWKVKGYFYNSKRGIPGAIVNNVFKHAQRQWDRSLFVQGSLNKSIGDRYSFEVNAKWAYDYMHYVNPDTTLMLIDNQFNQIEWYLSMANRYKIKEWWNVSLASDVIYNTLESDMDGFVYPKRFTWLTALSTAIDTNKIKSQASLLSTFVRENIDRGNVHEDDEAESAPDKFELTPSLFVTYKPWEDYDFNIRAFYKYIFRMPTFNDLYYTDIGNIKLKPEYTHQYNIGFQYAQKYDKGIVQGWDVQSDFYFNKVTDKIVAVPKGSGQYRWMMMNLGYVEILGMDFATSGTFRLGSELALNLKLTYTYQNARDFTKRENPFLQETTYGGQIAYIPWHSGSVLGSLLWRGWQLNYSFIYVGERYHSSANIREDYEQPWYTNDLTLVKTFKWKGIDYRLAAEVNNFLNQDYEVILNYPMPKRNYKFSVTIEI